MSFFSHDKDNSVYFAEKNDFMNWVFTTEYSKFDGVTFYKAFSDILSRNTPFHQQKYNS